MCKSCEMPDNLMCTSDCRTALVVAVDLVGMSNSWPSSNNIFTSSDCKTSSCLSGFPCFYCKPLSCCWCSLVTLTMLPPRPPQKQFPPVLTMFDRKQTATTTIHIAHSTGVQNLNTTSGVLYLLGGTQLCSFFFFWSEIFEVGPADDEETRHGMVRLLVIWDSDTCVGAIRPHGYWFSFLNHQEI